MNKNLAKTAPPVESNSKIGFYIFLGVILIMAILGLVAFSIQMVND